MLRVTWEWLGQDPALDLANTVAVADDVEHDLLAPAGEYERWASAEGTAAGLAPEDVATLVAAQPRLLRLRAAIREALVAVATDRQAPAAAVAELNRASAGAPGWPELHTVDGRLRERTRAERADRLLAAYARSAMQLVADAEPGQLRVCPAPSCGMLYRPGRSDQQWCSRQCGTRARVARHYRARK
ncbi:MAG: CGNR zinc finger domain-containing protein [Gemmatimonadaceae bacterium]